MDSRLRVLLVDDTSDLVNLLAAILRIKEFDAVAASSAKDALAIARSQPFDALVTDLHLPDIPGHALIRELLVLPHPPHRIIGITGYGEAYRAMALAAGADAVFTKPFDPMMLVGALYAEWYEDAA